MRAAQRMGQQEATPAPFLNPDPIACLVGHSNEAPLIMDGQRVTALIDSGAQVWDVSSQFCEGLTLQIQPLGSLLELEGTGGSTIPYLRYVEVNLQILGIKNYNEDVLLLGLMGVITKGEVTKLTTTWRQAYFGVVMFGSLQLPCTSQNRTGMEKEVVPSSPGVDTVEVNKFWLDKVQDHVCTSQRVTIPPLGTVSIHSNTSIRGHCMQVHILAKANTRPPVAYISGANCDLQRLTSGVLSGTHLFANFKCSFCQNPHQGSGWLGHTCQPSATSGSPGGNLGGPPATTRRDRSWRPWTSKA